MYDNFGKAERSTVLLKEAASTNDELKKMIYTADRPVFVTVIADRQTGGRGRLGRSFFSPDGGLYFSASYPLTGRETNIPFLTLLAGLCVSEAIEEQTGVKTLIKWPNDIYLSGKKLGGILCELVSGRTLTAVVGIGINVAVAADEIPSELRDIMTSFRAENKPLPDKRRLAEAVTEGLDACVYSRRELFSAGEKTVEEIRRRSFSIGKTVKYRLGESITEGVFSDITPTGAAVLLLPDGSKKEIFYGEITQ